MKLKVKLKMTTATIITLTALITTSMTIMGMLKTMMIKKSRSNI